MAKQEATVPMLVADPTVCATHRLDCFENIYIYEDFFLDSPVTCRVAVLDFDETTGKLRPGMPDGETLKEIAKRAMIHSTEKDSKPGGCVDVAV